MCPQLPKCPRDGRALPEGARAAALPLLLLAALIGPTAGCNRSSDPPATTAPPSSGGGTPPPVNVDVLFLGNSYTSTNNLPVILRDMATAAKRKLTPLSNAPGGNTLGAPQASGSPHSNNSTSLNFIGSKSWDFVILQEQSEIPTIEFAKNNFMIPGASILNSVIKANDPTTRVLLFQTWGRPNGGQFFFQGASPVFPDYDSMQDAVTATYEEVAIRIAADVAPVGEAWRLSLAQDPTLELHQADETHPNHAGSYLAACVFFAKIYDASPEGVPFTWVLPPAEAAFLQDVAAHAVWDPTCGLSVFGDTTTPANTLTLTATGSTGPGEPVVLTPGGLDPLQPGSLLFSSFSDAFLPFAKGVLLVDLTEQVLPARFIANGNSLTLTIPPEPEFTGLELYFQVLASDPVQVGETLFSPAVRLQVCP